MDYVKEITGLTFSSNMTSNNRRYLAVQEKRHNDLHAYVTIYDFKQVTNPKLVKSINMSELVYGSLRVKEADKGTEQEPTTKNIVSLSFSKDNKYMAAILTDASMDTRAIIYDWYSKNKLLATYDFNG